MAVFKFRNLNTGQATPVMEGEFTVGRADDAYIHLDDPSVSRRHAKVINNSGIFFVEDLGSANGTAAHGSYITGMVQVKFGDVVHIGSVPFRIDPEVAGEADAIPSAGLRTSNRAYMRRDTEKLPPSGELAKIVEKIAPENLSAPLVNTVTDSDAEELNAITIKEPEAPKASPAAAIRATSQGAFVPPVKPASTVLRQSVPLRRPSQKITLQPQAVAEPHPEPIRAPTPMLPVPEAAAAAPQMAMTRTSGTPLAVPKVTTPQAPAATLASAPAAAYAPTLAPAPAPEETGVHWGWWLIMFLGGLGTGLLLGLYFAKLFIDLGGKPNALPF